MIHNTDLKLSGCTLLHKIVLASSCSVSVFWLLTYRGVLSHTWSVLMQIIYCSEGREKHTAILKQRCLISSGIILQHFQVPCQDCLVLLWIFAGFLLVKIHNSRQTLFITEIINIAWLRGRQGNTRGKRNRSDALSDMYFLNSQS